jgi:hypothetical protein
VENQPDRNGAYLSTRFFDSSFCRASSCMRSNSSLLGIGGRGPGTRPAGPLGNPLQGKGDTSALEATYRLFTCRKKKKALLVKHVALGRSRKIHAKSFSQSKGTAEE